MFDLIDNLNINFKEIEEILLKNYNYYENDDTNKKEKIENKIKYLNFKTKINYKQKLNNKINNINKEKIINLILKYIESCKINDVINLDIYLNYNNKTNFNKEYKFKRGYDTKSTKRYNVFYKINVYFVDN